MDTLGGSNQLSYKALVRCGKLVSYKKEIGNTYKNKRKKERPEIPNEERETKGESDHWPEYGSEFE